MFGKLLLQPFARGVGRFTHRWYSHGINNPVTRAQIAERACERIGSLFERFGDSNYIGEPITTTEHSLQAALMARDAGEPEDVIAAALLHDVGHLLGLEAGFEPGMDGCGTPNHENIGHDFLLELGLPPSVAFLCKHHVSAKRYLCLREPGYYDRLSEASKTTLDHQGGFMTEEEASALEKDERWPTVLRFRTYDESAKEPNVKVPSVESFLPTIRSLITEANQKYLPSPYATTYVLSQEQLRRWDQDGMLVIRNALNEKQISELCSMAVEVGSFPLDEGPWLVHHEAVGEEGIQKRLCRVENFCNYHKKWGALCFGVVQDLVSQVEREPAVLFKDKLNFKGPGGGGFLCHQDATAYVTDQLATRHVSVMVAIDAATPENGCLQVAPGWHKKGILDHEDGVIKPELEKEMKFTNILVNPGDIVLFDS